MVDVQTEVRLSALRDIYSFASPPDSCGANDYESDYRIVAYISESPSLTERAAKIDLR
jgi:hypothetical protein